MAVFWTNKRMPDKAAHIAQCNPLPDGPLHDGRQRGNEDGSLSYLGFEIGDGRPIYSGSASGQRNFTLHVLLADVLLGAA